MTLDWEEAKAPGARGGRGGVKFCVAQNYRYGAGRAGRR